MSEKSVAQVRSDNRKRTLAMVGGVTASSAAATGNVAVKANRALKGRGSLKALRSAGHKSLAVGVGGAGAALATGAYNEKKFKEAKAAVKKSDPFGIEKRSPGLKPFKPPSKFKAGTKNAGRKAKTAFHNRTSKPGNISGGQSGMRDVDDTFGEKELLDRGAKWNGAVVGYVGGIAAGSAGAGAYHANKRRPLKRKLEQAAGVSKALGAPKVHRVTNLGTAAGRKTKRAEDASWKRWPGLDAKFIGGGTALGAGVGVYGAKVKDQEKRREMNRAIRHHKKAKLTPVAKRDKRDGPGVAGGLASAYGGSLAGGIGGAVVGAGGPKKYKANVKEGSRVAGEAGQRFVADNPPPRSGGVRAGVRYARDAQKAGVKAAKTVPGVARQMKGANIGSVVGAGAGVGAYVSHKKKQQKLYGGVGKSMTTSAFGVDHGEVSKKFEKEKSNPSGGRLAAGAAFSPIHGLVAGKGVKNKAKAGGTQWVGAMGGGAAGRAAGPAGALAGSLAGGAGATHVAHKRGWLKRQGR